MKSLKESWRNVNVTNNNWVYLYVLKDLNWSDPVRYLENQDQLKLKETFLTHQLNYLTLKYY